MRSKFTLVGVPIMALVFAAAAFAQTSGHTGDGGVSGGNDHLRQHSHDRDGRADHGPCSVDRERSRCDWAQFFVSNWNKLKVNKNRKIKLIQGDTQLGVNTSFAVSVAQSFASNSKVLAVVGPAGSQEVVASTSAYKSGGLGFISGSATRISLADGVTDGNRIGYFYRTVPNDAIQAPTVANYISRKLNATRVYIIDDQETYSQGLADGVQALLRARGVTRHARLHLSAGLGLLVRHREDPGQHAGRLHTVAVGPAGSDLRAAAQGGRQGRHHDVRLGRLVRPGNMEDHRVVRLVLPGRHVSSRSSGRSRMRTAETVSSSELRATSPRRSQSWRSPGRAPTARQPARRSVRRWPGSTFPRRPRSWESVSTSRGTATSATAGSGSTRSKATEPTSGSASASVRLRRDGVRPTRWAARLTFRPSPVRTACDSVTSRMQF